MTSGPRFGTLSDLRLAEAQAAPQAIGVSGVVTTDRASLPATVAEGDMLRPTTHIDFE
jgi:hypothetical protein